MLTPIPCNLYVISYTEDWSFEQIPKVVITTNPNMEEVIQNIKANKYDPNSIEMTETQYESIFKPLFETISQTNEEIRKIIPLVTPNS